MSAEPQTISRRATCSECGAAHEACFSCEDCFHLMLFWEFEDAALGVVHHLVGLGFHLQHPSRYSPEGLLYGIGLLDAFLREGVSPREVRALNRVLLDSGHRDWTIKNRGVPGAYDRPIRWTMTAADVVARGMAGYIDAVREWAQAIYGDLRREGYGHGGKWPGIATPSNPSASSARR